MAIRYSDKWAFIEDDPELDEEGCEARREAGELREQANALAHHAEELPEGELQKARLCEAVAMYRRADTCISRVAAGRRLTPGDRELVLQCRLNAACLALKAGDEASTSRICDEALEVDAENPHAALFQARAAARRDRADLVGRWLERAQRWARQRGEEELLREAEEFTRRAFPPASQQQAPATKPDPARWVQQAVALLRQRKAPEARRLLEQAVEVLDREDHGGPIEKFSKRAPRAVAFNALEALSEALAAQGELREAQRCGERALALLAEGPAEAPFAEPDSHRREGLLLFSLGHVAASSGGDPLPCWRKAIWVLERPEEGDHATEGQVLLELGTWQVERALPEQGAYDVEVVEEAIVALEHAADRFGCARSRLPADGAAEGARRTEMSRREFQARSTLASLLCSINETSDASRALQASAYLLDSVPEQPTPVQAEDWAAPCGKWAVAATKVGMLAEAESALLQQRRLGKAASTADVQLEALKALAVVRKRRHNDQGVEEALASVAELTPEREREGELRRMRRTLRQVAPDPEPPEPSQAALATPLPAPAPPTVVGVGGLGRRAPAALGKEHGRDAAALPAPTASIASKASAAGQGRPAHWWRLGLVAMAVVTALAGWTVLASKREEDTRIEPALAKNGTGLGEEL